ncbi:MAG TPA: hypothetical protein VE133_12165 [Candidatus Sulfotelmatobacter sp.]|nr:hypothetical protein [Candidatus Sulfotelmatobacter sp.]
MIHLLRFATGVLLITVALAPGVPAQAQSPVAGKTASDTNTLAGDWLGDSICVVRESACHDEKALYHVRKSGDQPNRFSLQADKIVDGHPEVMGTMECIYAPNAHTLHCELPKGVVNLTLQGARLEGNMKLMDGTLWRNITLKK